jgi:hypothetical protein
MADMAINGVLPWVGNKLFGDIQNLLGMRQGSMARTTGDTSLGMESDS